MDLKQRGFPLLWLIGLFCVIFNADVTTFAQTLNKRSSRITSSRTTFGTQVKSSSSSLSSINGLNFDCPEEFGYFPHPTDCTQYYVCVFGGALLESCTGGLMYSHELQTCDWPRNVGCDVSDSVAREQTQEKLHGQGQQQTLQKQQPQHQTNVPSRIRFGSAFTSPQTQQQSLKATAPPPQYHRQPSQVIQAQVHNIPPPPQLKVSPNPIITSRGQPKHVLEAQEEIAKLYADALETLPPVEEEETDRQQRVYRGQPSTVSQVQRDRDGIIHQPNLNVIPNHDKFNSYSGYGNQYSSDIINLDLNGNRLENLNVNDAKDLDLNEHKRRYKRDLGFDVEHKVQQEEQQAEQQPLTNSTKEAKFSSKISYESENTVSETETMQEIKELIKELYGPDYVTTNIEELSSLLDTKISKELETFEYVMSSENAKKFGIMKSSENRENFVRNIPESWASPAILNSRSMEELPQVEENFRSLEIHRESGNSKDWDKTANSKEERTTSNQHEKRNILHNAKNVNNVDDLGSYDNLGDFQNPELAEHTDYFEDLRKSENLGENVEHSGISRKGELKDSNREMKSLKNVENTNNNGEEERAPVNGKWDNKSRSKNHNDLEERTLNKIEPLSKMFTKFGELLRKSIKLENLREVAKSKNHTITEEVNFSRENDNRDEDDLIAQETQTEHTFISDFTIDDNPDADAVESLRYIRQLRPYIRMGGTRTHWPFVPTHFRSVDTSPYQQQLSQSFGSVNPFLSPPSTITYDSLNALNSVQKQNYQNYPLTFSGNYRPKLVFANSNFRTASPSPTEQYNTNEFNPFRPVLGTNYFGSAGLSQSTTTSTTLRPFNIKHSDLLPYILQSLRELKEQRKKLQMQNYSYYHLDIDPLKEQSTQSPFIAFKTTTPKILKNAQNTQISTMGGFYNNQYFNYPTKLTSTYHASNEYITTTPRVVSSSPTTTTESQYFKYNILANQKMKHYFTTLKPITYEMNTLIPVTDNINIVTAPKLNTIRPVMQSHNIIIFNHSLSSSYQPFTNLLTSTFRPLNTTIKEPLRLQFNLSEFISSLGASDLAPLNPTVKGMLNYLKEVNKPKSMLNENNSHWVPKLPTSFTTTTSTTASSKKSTKNYENFINRIPNQTQKTNSIRGPTKFTTSKPDNPQANDEYYDEEDELEVGGEEDTDLPDIDADEEIQPPSQMPPYAPMSETMAPPRSQMMPPLEATANPPFNAKPTYVTGFLEATTTRKPFMINHNFQQFYQPPHPLIRNQNQIPSFINFPSDYFQEIKTKLSTPSSILKLTHFGVKPAISTKPTAANSTATTTIKPQLTSTLTSTSSTPSTSTTTTTAPRPRYTIRPHRIRGQNKWHSPNTVGQQTNKTLLTLDFKHNRPAHIYRKRPMAAAHIATNSATAGGNENSLMHTNADVNVPSRVETSSPYSSQQTATPSSLYLQAIKQNNIQQHHNQVMVDNRNLPIQQAKLSSTSSPSLSSFAQPQPFSINHQHHPYYNNYYNTTNYEQQQEQENVQEQHNVNVDDGVSDEDVNDDIGDEDGVDVVDTYVPQQQQQQQQQQKHQNIPQHLTSKSLQQQQQQKQYQQHSLSSIQYSQNRQKQQQQQLPSSPPQSSEVQLPEQNPYDSYYSVYDDDIDLYRDLDYQQPQQQQKTHQQQQQQQHYQPSQQPLRNSQSQQSTYRPLDIFTTPSPPLREGYKSQAKPQRPSNYGSNQQALLYNNDYDEDLIAQIEQDNSYDQPTRTASRNPQISIQTLRSGSSSTVRAVLERDERNYYNTLTTPVPTLPNDAEEPAYIYEADYRDSSDYYYTNKKGSAKYTGKLKPLTEQDSYDVIGARLQNIQDFETKSRTATKTTTTITTTTRKPTTTSTTTTTSTSRTTTKNSRSKTHANKKLQQQEQQQQQQRSPPPISPSPQQQQPLSPSKQTKQINSLQSITQIPHEKHPSNPSTTPSVASLTSSSPKTPILSVVTQAHEKHTKQILTNAQLTSTDRNSTPAGINHLEEVENIYDESQNVQVQSSEPSRTKATEVNKLNIKLNDYSEQSKAGNLVNEKSKSSKVTAERKRIQNFPESEFERQNYQAKSREIKNNESDSLQLNSEEILRSASSSSTTLKYPATYNPSSPMPKMFEYSLQRDTNGFALRAQSVPLSSAEIKSQPIYERVLSTSILQPSTTVTPKSKAITSTTTSYSTTEKAVSSSTQSTYFAPSSKEEIAATTYAPPLRTWRNGRPTYPTTTMKLVYDNTFSVITEPNKVQTVAQENFQKIAPNIIKGSTAAPATTYKPASSTTSTTTTHKPTTSTPSNSLGVAISSERPIQSFTARTSIFKDNLQRTTSSASNRFVSPYKSLENILQKDERSNLGLPRSTLKPRYLASGTSPLPFLQTTPKPFGSYFLITSQPKNFNESIFATMATNSRNFSVSDAIITTFSTLTLKPPILKFNSSPTTTTTTSTTANPITSTQSTTARSTIIASSPLKLIQAEKETEANERPRSRGRSRYTFATVSNLLDNDEPTTYSPKYRFTASVGDATTQPSTSSLAVRRKIQRARISSLQHHRPSFGSTGKSLERYTEREAFRTNPYKRKPLESETLSEKPRAEALISSPLHNNQENSIEGAKSSEINGEEQVVAITDRPLKYFYSNKYRQNTPERTLAESLQNAGYITSSSASNKASFKANSVLEQLQLFLAGSDSEEDESGPPQFVNDFMEPAIKAAVEEIRNLYTNTASTTRLPLTTTTTTTLKPTTTAMPPTTAYTSFNSTQQHLNTTTIIRRTTSTTRPTTTTTSIATPTATPSSTIKHNKLSNSSVIYNASTSTTTTTTPKNIPKFPSSTSSFLPSSSIATTTTATGKYISSTPANTGRSSNNQPPARASRVNNAIKSSIAAAVTASPSHKGAPPSVVRSNKFSLGPTIKCSDTTSNAKCNEIPSRINSNSNRNRGSATYNQDRDAALPASNSRGTYPPRTRPTLKPSGNIVSKAQEFIDIYRYPPSRPEPIYPIPTPDKTAAKCRKDVCLLPDCFCGGKEIPGNLNVSEVPQIVLITFDDAVSTLNINLYEELFNNDTRKNPNGCPIRATFYVSHEWTNYGMIQDLYADGHELASHTISHSFGEQFSQKKWTREVAGQREILAAYGGVKVSDVRGMRAPFLSVGGNKMYKMLYDSNFTYDSSLPVYENRPPSWPYTFDYKIFHDCMIPPCPTRSYPGIWQVPMVMWQDLNGGRCSMGDACSNPGDADGVMKMIMKNFERHYTTNRAPFGLFYHAAWFTQPHHKEGFIKFLDAINAMPDVWIVTNWQALQWVRDPTPLSRINSFQPFYCDYSDRPKRCNNPKVCNLWHKSGVRYMKTCQPCPDIYPWTGKTGIRSSRIDNDIEETTT
ncbi:chitin deacetylase-like 5 [Glossina fuscipes fuscipes]